VEPLFLVAQNQAIPQLERVILAHSRRVVMRPTLGEAITALLGGAVTPRPGERQPSDPEAAPGPGREPAPAESAALRNARVLLREAEAQLRAGDLPGFGRTWERLREALGDTGSSPGGTP
jgi:uncharacterized protein